MNHVLSHPLLALALLGPALACLPAGPTVYHTLGGVAPAPNPSGGRAPALEVLPVRVPELLQRPQILIARDRGGATLASGHRWGNGLEDDLRRALVGDLGALLGGDRVVPSPRGAAVGASLRLEVDVVRCLGRPGGTLAFDAAWMISRSGGGPAVAVRRTTLELPVQGPGVEGLVAAHDAALGILAREVAQALEAEP